MGEKKKSKKKAEEKSEKKSEKKGKKKPGVVSEGVLELQQAIGYIESLLENMKKGLIVVQDGEQHVTLKPSQQVHIAVKASSKEDKEKFSLKLQWLKTVEDSRELPLVITDAEPALVPDLVEAADAAEIEETSAEEKNIEMTDVSEAEEVTKALEVSEVSEAVEVADVEEAFDMTGGTDPLGESVSAAWAEKMEESSVAEQEESKSVSESVEEVVEENSGSLQKDSPRRQKRGARKR